MDDATAYRLGEYLATLTFYGLIFFFAWKFHQWAIKKNKEIKHGRPRPKLDQWAREHAHLRKKEAKNLRGGNE